MINSVDGKVTEGRAFCASGCAKKKNTHEKWITDRICKFQYVTNLRVVLNMYGIPKNCSLECVRTVEDELIGPGQHQTVWPARKLGAANLRDALKVLKVDRMGGDVL